MKDFTVVMVSPHGATLTVENVRSLRYPDSGVTLVDKHLNTCGFVPAGWAFVIVNRL
jgi:hypothetical protein